MDSKPASFWSSLPGVLTGLAAVLTAAAGLYIAIGGDRTASEQPAPAPLLAAAPAPPAVTAETQVYPRRGTVVDRDGFVNVRATPSARSRIVATIRVGENFAVAPADTAWWPVRTNDGATGFVHASRVQLMSGARL